MKGNNLAIVLLVVGLLVGGGVGYFAAPPKTVTEIETEIVEVEPLSGKTVKIGYISSTTVGLETAPALVQELMGKDYNAYAATLGSDVEFQHLTDDARTMRVSRSPGPLLAIPDDNLYRMCPDDTIQAPAISRMIQSMGVKYVVCIYRGDAWADGIMNFFEPHFVANGDR